MNFSRAQLLLKKITEFMHSLQHDQAEVLPIERQLLLSYVDELRKTLAEEAELPQSEIDPFRAASAKKDSSPSLVKTESEPKTAASETETVRETHTDPESATDKESTSEQKEEKVPVIQSIETKTASQVKSTQAHKLNSDLDELFIIGEAKDLSEKLNQKPLSSLKSSMGINEKIFTINELFGGDDEEFKKITSHLESLDSYDQAKKYLVSEVAQKQKWADPERRSKAKDFIHRVHRLYLKG